MDVEKAPNREGMTGKALRQLEDGRGRACGDGETVGVPFYKLAQSVMRMNSITRIL